MARKRKAGRPKGSKNFITQKMQKTWDRMIKANTPATMPYPKLPDDYQTTATEPVATRLDTIMQRFETAIDEAIVKLNRMV